MWSTLTFGAWLVHNQRIVHGANVESTTGVHRTIVASGAMCSTALDFLFCPELLDVPRLSSLLVCKTVTFLSTKYELIVISFDVGCAADGEGEVNCFVRRRSLIQIDNVKLLLDDIQEAQGVAPLVPEWRFTQTA